MQSNFVTTPRSFIAVAVTVALAAVLPGCGTMSSLGGKNTKTAGDDNTVGGLWSGGLPAADGIPGFTKKPGPNDRPTRVGWLSARASHCGFVFDPAQLRMRYFAFEQSYGADARRMQEIQRAYDYSLESTAERAKQNPNYCTRQRVDEIRPELNRYLAGDFRTF
jgi:hypothetical protein